MEACGIDVFATARQHGFTIHVVRGPDDPQPYFGLVLIELSMGKAVEREPEREPENPWALWNLGACLLKVGQVAEAETLLHHQRDPNKLISQGKPLGANEWIVWLDLRPHRRKKYADPSLPQRLCVRLIRLNVAAETLSGWPDWACL